MRNVLITGADGFIGQHLTQKLAQESDIHIHAVSRSGRTAESDVISSYRLDLLNHKETKRFVDTVKPSHLIHLAWCTEHGAYWTSEENRRWLAASKELINCFSTQGGRRVVVIGTCAQYAWDETVCKEEQTPRRAHSLYGECKNSLQDFLAHTADAQKLSWAWAYLFHLYGPGESAKRLVPQVISSLVANKSIDTSICTQVRDFMFVLDTASALSKLLLSKLSGPINIASGKAIEIRSMLEELERQLDRKEFVRYGARPMSEAEPMMLIPDTTRMGAELGFTPQFELDAGIAQSIAWWRKRLANEVETR